MSNSTEFDRPLDYDLSKLRDELGIVIDGNTASINVTSGQYVIVKDSTISGVTDGLYKSTANVSAGNAFTSADLTAQSNGGLNAIADHVRNVESKIPIVGVKTWRGWIEGTNVSINCNNGSPVKLVLFASDGGYALYVIKWIGSIGKWLVSNENNTTHDELTMDNSMNITATLSQYECLLLIDI